MMEHTTVVEIPFPNSNLELFLEYKGEYVKTPTIPFQIHD